MKAMLLAAGLGKRMWPLTLSQPKCLIDIVGQPLIAYHLKALAKCGITEIVINVSNWAAMIKDALGDGADYGVNIKYSVEEVRLETGGGIQNALPLLGDEPFAVVNTDVWTDYDFSLLPEQPEGLVHLVLVNNPDFHPDGDFHLEQGQIDRTLWPRLTYSGIGVYRPELFKQGEIEPYPLSLVLNKAIESQQISGEHYQGQWVDVGTVERLESLNKRLF